MGDTGLIAKELFSGNGVSQEYGPYMQGTVEIDISQWGLKTGDLITLRTWYKANGFQTERNGAWVQETNSVPIDVAGDTSNGVEFTIQYGDAGGVATKIKQEGSSSLPAYFYTDKGTHALLVNGQPVIDGMPIPQQLLCSSWCAANTNPFAVKVTWTSCNGCTDPSVSTPTPAPSLMCSSWCATNTNPSSVKVTWTSCNGCTDPSVSTSTPAPSLMCSSWCAANTMPFSVKVTWTSCSGCVEQASTPRRLGTFPGKREVQMPGLLLV